MEFSEKLSALLSLTATKNVMLARALEIDTAQISRLKKGTRKMRAQPYLKPALDAERPKLISNLRKIYER